MKKRLERKLKTISLEERALDCTYHLLYICSLVQKGRRLTYLVLGVGTEILLQN
jgi:hypothetical protein